MLMNFLFFYLFLFIDLIDLVIV